VPYGIAGSRSGVSFYIYGDGNVTMRACVRACMHACVRSPRESNRGANERGRDTRFLQSPARFAFRNSPVSLICVYRPSPSPPPLRLLPD